MSEPFIGQIMAVPYAFAPYQWAFCQGQQMSMSQQQALYSLLGTNFGGSGNNFNLPDLRGRVAVGAGPTSIPGLGTLQLGATGGAAQQTLSPNQLPSHTHPAVFTGTGGGGGGGTTPTASGTVTLNVNGTFSSNVSVTGDLQATDATGTESTPQPGWVLGTAVSPTGSVQIYADPAEGRPVTMTQLISSGSVSGPVSGSATGPVSLNVTGGAGGITGGTVTVQPNQTNGNIVPTMPPYVVVNNIIALQGIYPTRD